LSHIIVDSPNSGNGFESLSAQEAPTAAASPLSDVTSVFQEVPQHLDGGLKDGDVMGFWPNYGYGDNGIVQQ